MPSVGSIAGALQPQGARLALATVSTSVMIQKGEEQHCLVISAEAADLTLLNKNAPFLCEHHHWIEELLGDVREAWISNDKLYCIVRFCPLPRADIIWTLLEQEFPIGCSLGYRVLDCEEIAAKTFRITKWKATEVSACVLVGGADPHARIVFRPFAEINAEVQKHRAVRLEIEKAAKFQALQPDRWRAWARNGASQELSTALGVDEERLRDPLGAAVERHLEQLQESLDARGA